MFTVCPKCALTLVVTAGDLRIGQGYVRCGRCSNVFNALVGLSEERQAALIGQAPAPGPSAEGEPIALEAPLDAPENGDADAVPDSALEFNADSTELSEVFVEPRPGPHDIASGTFETIVLEADDLLAQTSESASIAESASGADTLTTTQDAANDGDAAAMAAANDASLDEPPTHEFPAGFDRSRIEAPRPRAERPSPPAEPVATQDLAESFVGTGDLEHPRRRMLAWSAGIAALVLAFAAQLVHHNRHDLAVDGRFREPLSALYGTLGLSLAPRWNLVGYDVRQLGASAGPGAAGMLTVRASVQNGAGNPQPLPLLRVTVQDRFGNRIAARDVPPAEYATGPGAESRLLDVGERVDAEVRLADPGPDAVGFELDACLRFEGGRISCANDQRAR